MPAWVDLHPHAVPSDVVHSEQKDAVLAVDEVNEQVSDLQMSLEVLSQRLGKLNGAVRAADLENTRLRSENSELRMQLSRSLVGSTGNAGTGEMPPVPQDALHTEPPDKIQEVMDPRATNGPAPLWLDSSSASFFPARSGNRGSIESLPRGEESSTALAERKRLRMSTRSQLVPSRLGRRGVFADATEMKEQVRKAIARPQFDVTNYYYTKGWAQFIARSLPFEYVTLAVIFINAIYIAIDAEFNTAEGVANTSTIFTVADSCFCAFFTIELCIRFGAFRFKRHVFKDIWFAFDLALVLVMIGETWILPLVFAILGKSNTGLDGVGNTTMLRLLRLLRITRMARMVKLLRCVPELIIVVKGIGVALRSVFYTWILLIAVIYVFAIAFRQISINTALGDKYFSGVPTAMYTLLLKGALPDLADFMEEVGLENVGMAILLMLFILLVTLTVMNMLIGVLVDVVGVVSKVENYELQVAFVKQKLLSMMETSGLDEDGDHSISRKEFGSILVKPEAAKILYDLGVDPVGLVDFTDFIFKDEEELDFPRFMEIVLQLRGTNTATVRDVVDMRKWMSEEFRNLDRNLRGPRSRGGGSAPPYGRMGAGLRGSEMPSAPSPSRGAWGGHGGYTSFVQPRAVSVSPVSRLQINDKLQSNDNGSGRAVSLLSVQPIHPAREADTLAASPKLLALRTESTTPPLIPGQRPAQRSRQNSASPSRPGMEDDLWDEEV